MPFKVPAYPDTLTNADWQKNKGKIAKMAGETGIGDLMKKAEAAYKGVDWKKFRLSEAAKGMGAKRTMQDIEDAYKDAQKEGPKLKALDEATRKLEDAAGKLAKEWAKDKLIPSSSTKHVTAVGEAAKKFNYAITLGTISDALTKERKECEDGLNMLLAEHKKLYTKLVKYLDVFEPASKGMTLDKFQGFWSENIRGVGTILPLVNKDHAEFKAEWDEWKKHSNAYKAPKDEDEMKKKISLLIKVAKSTRTKMDKVM